MVSTLIALLSGCTALAQSTGPTIHLSGAAGDGRTDDTAAFVKAIDACREKGGTIEIPAGAYLVGPLDLCSNLTLKFARTAVLIFSNDPAKYPTVNTRWEGVLRDGRRPCLWAKDCKNITILGGTLDGQGAAWWAAIRNRRSLITEPGTGFEDDANVRRGPLVQFRDCQNVTIDGTTFMNSPFWTIHLLLSDDIVVRNCQMLAPPDSPNTDAMDIDSCRRVLVENCHASDGDDAFTLKSGKDEDGRKVNRPTEDVTVRNCTVEHAHGGVVIGSEMSGSVRRIRFENCDFSNTDAGVRIKSTRGRGGVVEDVIANNIQMRNVTQAFVLSMAYTRTQPEAVSDRTPKFHDIHLSNIVARDSRKAGTIDGLPELPIEDITFSNLDISAHEPITLTDAKNITFDTVKIRTDSLPALKQTRTEDVKVTGWDEAVRASTQPSTTR